MGPQSARISMSHRSQMGTINHYKWPIVAVMDSELHSWPGARLARSLSPFDFAEPVRRLANRVRSFTAIVQ